MTVINKGTSVNKENRVRNPLLILKSWCLTIFFNNEIFFYLLFTKEGRYHQYFLL